MCIYPSEVFILLWIVKCMRKAVKQRKRRKNSRLVLSNFHRKLIVLFVTLLVLTMSGYSAFNYLTQDNFVELDTIEVYGESLVLGANCVGAVGGISKERGEYIQLGKDEIINERPTVYDVFKDTLDVFDIKLESVKITRIENRHFLSTMLLSSGNKIFEADARPSDAIGLALRTKSKIYINRTLLNEIGVNICNANST